MFDDKQEIKKPVQREINFLQQSKRSCVSREGEKKKKKKKRELKNRNRGNREEQKGRKKRGRGHGYTERGKKYAWAGYKRI